MIIDFLWYNHNEENVINSYWTPGQCSGQGLASTFSLLDVSLSLSLPLKSNLKAFLN